MDSMETLASLDPIMARPSSEKKRVRGRVGGRKRSKSQYICGSCGLQKAASSLIYCSQFETCRGSGYICKDCCGKKNGKDNAWLKEWHTSTDFADPSSVCFLLCAACVIG